MYLHKYKMCVKTTDINKDTAQMVSNSDTFVKVISHNMV